MLASRTDCMFCLQAFDICFHEVSTRVALSADARTVLDTTLSRESSLKSFSRRYATGCKMLDLRSASDNTSIGSFSALVLEDNQLPT